MLRLPSWRFWWGEVKHYGRVARYKVLGGTLTSTIKAVDGGVVSEEAFYEGAILVGYYAYGHFDPSMPYIGQPKVKIKNADKS